MAATLTIVSLPEAGETAELRFTVDALEDLEAQFGAGYLKVIAHGLRQHRPTVLGACVRAALKHSKVDPATLPWGLPLEELRRRILDGLSGTLYGMTFAEQQARDGGLFGELGLHLLRR